MFDPASLGASLQPGDKVAMTFHKGQPKSSGPTFMDNVTRQQGQAQAASQPAVMPGMDSGVMDAGARLPSDPMAERQALMQAMRQRLGLGQV